MTNLMVPKNGKRWGELVDRYVDVRLRDLVEWLLAGSFLVGVFSSWVWLMSGKVWALLIGFLIIVGLGFVYRRNVEFYKEAK